VYIDFGFYRCFSYRGGGFNKGGEGVRVQGYDMDWMIWRRIGCG
jgi:hypothetical protein